jgi:RNA polymerase sigma-70 factor (sigma-E family)
VIVTADLDEFSGFVAARGAQLFRMAYLLAGDRHAAEDLTQTTLGRLYAAWASVRRADNPVAYSRTVMVRLYVKARHKTRLERSAPEVPDDGHTNEPTEDTALRVTLFAALAELSSRDRAIVVLRYWEDHSVEMTADILGVSSTTVRTRSRRALAKLRSWLDCDLSELVGL